MPTNVTGQASNTYPAAMIYAMVQDAYDYYYLFTPSQPLTRSTLTNGDLTYNFNSVTAANYCRHNGADFWNYSVPTSFTIPNPPYATGYINGSVTEDITQQSVFFFKVQWSGPLPAPTLPPSLSLLLKTQETAGASVTITNPTHTGVLSATATATDGAPFNETASASAGDTTAASGPGSVVGYHLVTAAVDQVTGIATVFLNGHRYVNAVNTAPYGVIPTFPVWKILNGPAYTSASTSVGAGVRLDNRAVTITRDNARSPGKVYSPDGQLHGEYQDVNGTWHGETTYSYLNGTSASGTSPTLNGNWQNFHANLGGTWTQKNITNPLGPIGTVPDVTWAWTPNESQDTWNTATCEMPQGGVTYFPGGSSGKASGPASYPITYTATDNGDHATAGASYALTVHEQWDNLRLDPSHPFDVVDNDVLVTVGGHQITQENDAASTPSPVGPLSVAFTVGATLSLQLNGAFKLSDLFTLGGNFQATASVSGTVGEQITGPPIPPKSYIQLYFHTHYHKNHWLVDHYTPTGYDATYAQTIDSTPDIAELHWGHSNLLPF